MFIFRSLLFLFICSSLHAFTELHVTQPTDSEPGGRGGTGELRLCLNIMNEQLNTAPDDYAITFATPMTIQLNGILPIINNSGQVVTITIGDDKPVIIDGQSTYPGFFIPAGNVTIKNITFQNCVARGGTGGNGISGGGGGMGAGGAIYAPQSFLYPATPEITLINVSTSYCSAIGGNGGNALGGTLTGNEGAGGGGGFAGNGGSVTTTGSTGGGGGGGFGGNGGDVTTNADIEDVGGGGGGGGGIGSRATIDPLTNLGNGGADSGVGSDGNAFGITTSAGSGGGGNAGGELLGGGGGGNPSGGGGGGAQGTNGTQPLGSRPPGGSVMPSGGTGGDGGGGGGAAVVRQKTPGNEFDAAAGDGGYGGGGGGAAGLGSGEEENTANGGSGGVGGGGGGGGCGFSFAALPANGGNSLGGGGGGGGGPQAGTSSQGGTDIGGLGGGEGGAGAAGVGVSSRGGGGGGGSGLGGAIFVDSGVRFTIQALQGVPTLFNTVTDNYSVQAGVGGTAPGGSGGADGDSGAAEGPSIFLRENSALYFVANEDDDILTLDEAVSFVDDTEWGGTGTSVFITGSGTVIYNGISEYRGNITINNANFKVNGAINLADVSVCRNTGFGTKRGQLSGRGTLTGKVFANSGTIAPDAGQTLTLGRLELSEIDLGGDTLGSLVKITFDGSAPSLVAVTDIVERLAGVLEIDIDSDTAPGSYVILTSAGITTGTFREITFTGSTPNYRLSYLPVGSPTYVQFDFLGYLEAATNFSGAQKKNNMGLEYELYNQLTWTPSSSDNAAGYYLYRDGQQIVTILNAATSFYQDHNRPRGASFVYSLVTFDGDGNTSSSVTTTVS